MASNCLVINSNNSSLPEVNLNKECLFNPLELSDIFEKIKYIVNLSDEDKLVLKEKNVLFAKRFTWEKTSDKTLKIFN
jgi:glycosyltransferase involved in cell wall biosynthesis